MKLTKGRGRYPSQTGPRAQFNICHDQEDPVAERAKKERVRRVVAWLLMTVGVVAVIGLVFGIISLPSPPQKVEHESFPVLSLIVAMIGAAVYSSPFFAVFGFTQRRGWAQAAIVVWAAVFIFVLVRLH